MEGRGQILDNCTDLDKKKCIFNPETSGQHWGFYLEGNKMKFVFRMIALFMPWRIAVKGICKIGGRRAIYLRGDCKSQGKR
jgi:hypothetical protein